MKDVDVGQIWLDLDERTGYSREIVIHAIDPIYVYARVRSTGRLTRISINGLRKHYSYIRTERRKNG